jgi:protease-3
MKEADFEQYKQAMINELKQRPQTLSEEAGRFANDFDRGNFAFDTRHKLIEQIKQLTPTKLADYFHQAVIQPQGLAVLSQVSGSGQEKADYAVQPGWVTYPNASALQKTLPRKVATP